jgi:hypothetical protein
VSCYECAGRSLIGVCPTCAPETEEEEIPPYDQGYEDRYSCKTRGDCPRYWHPESTAEWQAGWDAAQIECEEGNL